MKKILKWGAIAFAVFILISLIANGSDTDTPQNTQTEQQISQDSARECTYEVVSREKNKTVENIDVLVQSSESQTQAIAEEVKSSCSMPCNINVYDDQKALDLQNEYDAMMANSETVPADLESWKKANYVFVADHYIGSIDFSSENYNDYPFRDWYYDELKSQ